MSAFSSYYPKVCRPILIHSGSQKHRRNDPATLNSLLAILNARHHLRRVGPSKEDAFRIAIAETEESRLVRCYDTTSLCRVVNLSRWTTGLQAWPLDPGETIQQ